MLTTKTAPLAFAALVAAAFVPAPAQLLELDHVYILVPNPSAAAHVIAASGFTIDTTRVNRHVGGGTASMAVFFDNAYLEILWLDPTVSVTDSSSLERMREASRWRPTGPSPFGVGLRRTPGAPDSLPYVGERTRADWMQPGSTMFRFTRKEGEPNVFVVPDYMAVPSWIDQVREGRPAWLRHDTGVNRVTAVTVHGGRIPSAADVLGEVDGLSFPGDPELFLEIQFDGGVEETTLDLRPELPLVIHY